MSWATIIVVGADLARDKDACLAYLVEVAERQAEEAAERGLKFVRIARHTVERAVMVEGWDADGNDALVGENVARLIGQDGEADAVVVRIEWDTEPVEPAQTPGGTETP